MRRVRVGRVYRLEPVFIDRGFQDDAGKLVKVINLPGCPPANTMGHCYVQRVENGKFLGLVCCNSLQPTSKGE